MVPVVTSSDIWRYVFAGDVDSAITVTHDVRGAVCEPRERELVSGIFFDPSMSSSSGHQFPVALVYRELASELGCQLKVLHSYSTSLAPFAELRGFFLVPHHTLTFRSIQTACELKNVNEYFEREYSYALRQFDSAFCVFATARYVNIVGAVNAVAAHPRARQLPLIFTVFEADDAPDCSDRELISSAFTQAASILQERYIPYKIIVETKYIRNYLLDCGFRSDSVGIYEYVAAYHVTDGVARYGSTRGRIRVGFLGGSRPVKNPEMIARLIVEQEPSSEIKWCVQFDLDYIGRKLGQAVVEKLLELREMDVIELYVGKLDERAYNNLFCSLDIVVMPYATRYQNIGSGIICQAVYAEVIPVIPKRSSMYEFYLSLGGEAPSFDSLSDAALWGAIREAVRRLVELKKSAKRVRAGIDSHPGSVIQWRRDMIAWLSDIAECDL